MKAESLNIENEKWKIKQGRNKQRQQQIPADTSRQQQIATDTKYYRQQQIADSSKQQHSAADSTCQQISADISRQQRQKVQRKENELTKNATIVDGQVFQKDLVFLLTSSCNAVSSVLTCRLKLQCSYLILFAFTLM